MSYLLPTFSGPAGALVQDPAPIVTVNGQRVRITKVHPTEGISFDRLGAEPLGEDHPETVIESACGLIGGTFADLAAVVAHMENPPAPVLSVQEIWEQKLAGVIVDPVSSIELKASVSAQNRFAGMETLMKSGLDQGQITTATEVTIWDAANQPHVKTVAEARAILFRYGIQWMNMFNEFAP